MSETTGAPGNPPAAATGCVASPAAVPAEPVPASARPFRIGAQQAILVFLAYLGVQVAAGFFLGIAMTVGYFARHHSRASRLPADFQASVVMACGLAGLLLAGAVTWWLARRMLRRESPAMPLRPIAGSWGSRRLRLAGALAGVCLAMACLLVMTQVPPPKDFHPGAIGGAIARGGWPLVTWIALAVLVAPLIEEFLFRGVMWTGLSRAWGPYAAALVVTGLFVALHVPEAGGYRPALVFIGLLGAATLAARLASKALGPAIFLHAGYNLTLSILLFSAYS